MNEQEVVDELHNQVEENKFQQVETKSLHQIDGECNYLQDASSNNRSLPTNVMSLQSLELTHNVKHLMERYS